MSAYSDASTGGYGGYIDNIQDSEAVVTWLSQKARKALHGESLRLCIEFYEVMKIA